MATMNLQMTLGVLDKATAPLKTLGATTNKLAQSVDASQSKLASLNSQLADVSVWRDNKKAVLATAQELGALNTKTSHLAKSLAASKKRTVDFSHSLEAAKKEATKFANELKHAKKLKVTSDELQAVKDRSDKAKGSLKSLRAEFKASNQETTKITHAFDASKKSAKALTQQHQHQKIKLQMLRGDLSKAGISTDKLAQHTKGLKADVSRLNAALKKEETLLDRVAEKTKKVAAAKESLVKSQAFLANTSFTGTAAMQTGRSMLNAAASPIGISANYEESISRLGAVAIKTPDDAVYKKELTKLDQAARKFGITTSFSASQAAEGMQFLAMAGFDTNKIIATMPGVMNLAKAGATDLGTASDIASDIMSGFGLKAKDMNHVGDVLTATFTSSNTTLSMLGETMKYVAPEARGVGMSIEQTAAAAGLLANVGIKGSMAGTALRSMISSLAAPSKAAKGVLDDLGVKTKDEKGNLIDFATTLSNVAKATENMGTGDRKAAFKTVFGVEAGTAAAELINKEGTEKALTKFAKVIEAATGVTERTARRQGENAKGGFAMLSSSLESLSITAGALLLPQLTWLADKTKSLALWTEDLIKNNKGLATALGTSILVVGGLAVAGGAALTFIAGVGGVAVTVAAGLKILGINASFASKSLKATSLANMASMAKWGGGVALAAAGGYAVGTGLNWAANQAMNWLTDGKNKTVAGAAYDFLNPNAGQLSPDKQAKYDELLKRNAIIKEKVIKEKAAQNKTINDNSVINLTINGAQMDEQTLIKSVADEITYRKHQQQQGALYDYAY